MEKSEQGFCIGLIESLDLDLGFHTGCIQFINSALYFKIILCFMAFLLNLKDAEKKILWFYCVQLSTLSFNWLCWDT